MDNIEELRQKSKQAALDTENTIKFIFSKMEAVRRAEGIAVKDWVEMMGFSSPSSYFSQVTRRKGEKYYGVPFAFPVIQFCYLFGYNLKVDKNELVARKWKDLLITELGGCIAALPDSIMLDVIAAIGKADFSSYENPRAAKQEVLNTIVCIRKDLNNPDIANKNINFSPTYLAPQHRPPAKTRNRRKKQNPEEKSEE